MPRAPKVCARCGNDQPCPLHAPKPWQGSTSRGFPRATRDRIIQREPICSCSGCRRCSPEGCRRPSTEADHVIERADGGTDDETNGCGMCGPCHRVKTSDHAARQRHL